MWYTNMSCNTGIIHVVRVRQKYLVTSIKVGCATRSLYDNQGQKAEGAPTNELRGRGSGPCRL